MNTSNPAKVRFGYVGCGFVAQQIHVPNFASLPDCDFRAIAEVRPGLGQQVADYYGIPKVYASHHEIGDDPEIEAVGVSGPYALQGVIAEDLLRAGKHVFMEKPMAVSLSRARSIVAAEEASGKRLMVGYMKRYDPGNILLQRRAQQWIESGEAGRLLLARNHGFCGNWTYAQDPNVKSFEGPAGSPPPPSPDQCPDWLPAEHKNSYLSYLQQWTHNINLLRFFLGDDAGSAQVKAVDLDSDGMTGLTVLEINGIRALIESAGSSFHAWDEQTQLYFEGGWLRTESSELMHKETAASFEIYRSGRDGSPPRTTREHARPAWAYREEAKAFLQGVASGTPFSSSAADTLTDVRLYEEIYRRWLGIG